jgi:hypothetical protein
MYNLYNSNEVAEYQHNVLALFFVFYFAKHFWNRYNTNNSNFAN